ncbi:MAG: hypothetical protein ACXVI3_03725 [Halobacteriota archaeon]
MRSSTILKALHDHLAELTAVRHRSQNTSQKVLAVGAEEPLIGIE